MSDGEEKRLKTLRAFLDMVEGGDGLVGEDAKSRELKQRLRAEIDALSDGNAHEKAPDR